MTKKHLEIANSFIRKATEDIILLNKIADDGEISVSIYYFHAQQAVEKLLKALLSKNGIRFGKTHNIRELMDLLADTEYALPTHFTKFDALTPYGTIGRYEDLSFKEPFTRQEIRRMIADFKVWVEANM